ncbi:Dynein assembly factor 1, axonemal like protein [Eufriesea mexicana]|uniref:Dynein axonemal assembly factor 1 homolog n=1 Tax=Eufriesea mexicana TaxID=516756 RepID=A0A310SKT1_9HYME|nr:Dynein assembly factor 1, axonemal like protein [Eufriesea mexicana]
MQEECDFQTAFVEKKLSTEARLDAAASSAHLSETEIKKSIPKDSSVDFDVLSTSSSDVYTKMYVELQRNECTSEAQASDIKSTPESIPEVENEDDCNWLSYYDCSAIFDVTCENLSYYNSTKAEKDSDSDLDDTLNFDDAEEGEALLLDENDCCSNSYCQRSFEEVYGRKLDKLDRFADDDPVISDKICTTEIISHARPSISEYVPVETLTDGDENQDKSIPFRDSENQTVDDQRDRDVIRGDEELEKPRDSEVSNQDGVNVAPSRVTIEETTEELKMSENVDFSSDSEEENEENLVYSSPNVNISAYFKFRDSMREPKFEATLDEPNLTVSSKESLTLEEIVKEPVETDKKITTTDAQEQCSRETRLEEDPTRDISENTCSDQGKESKLVEPSSPEEYLEKLAEITESDCPRTEEEARETLKKIAEGKAEIENRKNEALKDLSAEFNEIEKLVAETKPVEGYKSESDESLDEAKEKVEGIAMPLTKDQVTESFKLKTTRKDAQDEERRRAELLQECLQIIPKSPEAEEEEAIRDEAGSKVEQSLTEVREKMQMTEQLLKKHCKENKLYQTPYLNDVLYLHYKGFSFIENLEKYTGLKCLWLENNGIREIANLENQSELKCLYLQSNLISKIENLGYQTKLDTLNLSHNMIRRIENLDSLKFLNTLNLSHNYLQDTADIEHLRLLDSLSVLDISHNRIDSDEVVNILGDMRELRVVTLMGNPVLRMIRLYRKTMILKCKNLRYLDDRPVFPRDRACAEAWMRGGPEEEAAERKRWIEAEQKKINDSVQALINKRKLCKPVGTSEKEAEDKKKTKEDEEVATTTLVCTSSELFKLKLEKKKKSGTSSSNSSSASSSSDEEVENAEEDDGTGQKGIEKSDGRRPMAEEGRKACGDIGKEILFPWKTEASSCKEPKRLVEVIEGSKEYLSEDAGGKMTGKKILDERRNDDGPLGSCALAHYEKLVPETTNETEITLPCCKQGKNDTEGTSKSSLDSVNIFDRTDAEKNKEGNIASAVNDQASRKDILDNYRRRDDPHPLSSQLSSIREDMKEFCADMDKFVEDNNIVFKNGEVKRFWGEREELRTEMKADISLEKEEKDLSTKEHNFKWWNTRERKLKVQGIMKMREEMQRSRMEITDDAGEKVADKAEAEGKKEVSSPQGVYDLLNLKTCPNILLKSVRTYPENEDASMLCESSKNEGNQERLSGVYKYLFNEMENRNETDKRFEKKSISSHELLHLEKIEEAEEGIARSSSCVDMTLSDSDTAKLVNEDKSVRIEILEASPNIEPVNSVEDNELDESLKINNYAIDNNNMGEGIKEEADETSNVPEENNFGENQIGDSQRTVKVRNDSNETQSSETQSATSMELPSHMEKSIHSTKSQKRSRDGKSQDTARKKSHLIEEMDAEKDRGDRETGNKLTEKCRRHFMEEAKKFVKKESPLIDKCIENLLTNRNPEGKWNLNRGQEDFLACASFSPFFDKTVEDSEQMVSSPGRSQVKSKEIDTQDDAKANRETKDSYLCSLQRSDMESIVELLKEPQTPERSSMKMCKDLYKEFCEHVEQENSKRKLLIEPDFMKRVAEEEKKPDVLSSRETKQSNEVETKSLIEVVSEDSTNVNELGEFEGSPVDPEDPAMDAALREKILKSINAPKSDEQRERGRKSADKLMKVSREAMAKGKSMLEEPSDICNQKRCFDDSRAFFMNLLKEDSQDKMEANVDPPKSIDEKPITTMDNSNFVSEPEEPTKLSSTEGVDIADSIIRDNKVLDTEKENGGRARKSLEMQVVQGN